MATPLGPKYIPYSYMDPLGTGLGCGLRRNAPTTQLQLKVGL